MNDMQSMLSDKDNFNKALTDSCNDLIAKFEDMKETVEQSVILHLEQIQNSQAKEAKGESE